MQDPIQERGFPHEAAFLQDWIERLQQTKYIILVEGKEDVRALKHFGIGSWALNRKPLYAIVEEIVAREVGVILLMDLDKAGKKLYAKLRAELNPYGVPIDDFFREELYACTKLSQIEGLVRYYERIQQKH